MGTYIQFMRSPNPWTFSSLSKMKLNSNLERKLKLSKLTVVTDPLIKGLIPKVFHEHIDHMGIIVVDNLI